MAEYQHRTIECEAWQVSGTKDIILRRPGTRKSDLNKRHGHVTFIGVVDLLVKIEDLKAS